MAQIHDIHAVPQKEKESTKVHGDKMETKGSCCAGGASSKVSELIKRNVQTVEPSATIHEAAKLMKMHDIGFVPVVDKNAGIVGVLTDRDIVIRVIAEGKNPSQVKVAEIASKDVAAVGENATVGEAEQLMKQRKIRRVLVLNQQRQPVGVITLANLSALEGHHQDVGKVMKHVTANA